MVARRAWFAGCLASIMAVSGSDVCACQSEPVFVETTIEAGLHQIQLELVEPLSSHGMTYMTGGAAAGDVNGDGLVDLYVTRLSAADSLYRNNGDGTFDDVSVEAGFSEPLLTSNGAALGDVDNDGDLDLALVDEIADVVVLQINQGGLLFGDGFESGDVSAWSSSVP